MLNTKIFLLMVMCTIPCCFFITAQDASVSSELQLQEAFYQEEVLGNIDKAIVLYQALLASREFPRPLKPQAILRMALCYEKLGKAGEAEKIYSQILQEYTDFPDIIRLVTAQIREHSRQQQIKELRQQLQTLAEFSPALRTQLEEELKKLQEKIQELEKQKPAAQTTGLPQPTGSVPASPEKVATETETGNKQLPPSTTSGKTDDNKESLPVEPQKISGVLALHLYHVARNLYQQGFFVSARENLKKALHFDPHHSQAGDLLKEVEAMLSQRETPLIMRKASETDELLSSASNIALGSESKEDIELIDMEYSLEPWSKRYNLEPGKLEIVWVNNFVRIIKSLAPATQWLYPAAVHYHNNKLRIKQTPAIHEKIQKVLELMGEAKDLHRIQATLCILPNDFTYLLDQPSNSLAYLGENGVSYTLLSSDAQVKIEEFLAKTPANSIYTFSEQFLLAAQKIIWKHTYEMPLVQGYQGKNLQFKFYAPGIHMRCERDAKDPQLEIKIFVQKIVRPIDVIMTAQGPVEHPCIIEQQSNLRIAADQAKTLLIRGLLYPYENHTASQQKLYLLLKMEPLALSDLLRQKEIVQPVQELLSKDYSLRYYDVESWQASQEKTPGYPELPGDFLIKFIEDQWKDLKLTTPLKIVNHYLVVYGPPTIHQRIEQLLQGLKERRDTLCVISIYLLSLERYTLHQLLKNWRLTPAKENLFRVYPIGLAKEEMMKQLQAVENINFHYTLGPTMMGNTQRLLLKDCQVRSCVDGISKTNFFWQSNLIEIYEGLQVETRPIVFSEENGVLELNIAVHHVKGAQNMVYGAAPWGTISGKIPEVQIQRANLYLPFQKGYSYLVAGFQYGEMSPTRDFVCLITPDILKNKEESATPSTTEK